MEATLAGGCSPVAVVVGAEREMITTALQGLPTQLLPNDSWQRGIGTSIRAGVAALQDCDALLPGVRSTARRCRGDSPNYRAAAGDAETNDCRNLCRHPGRAGHF